MINQFKEGGYTDFTKPMDFYTLWRGISTAFFAFIKAVCKFFGIDVEEGKTTTTE